jgi:hypothetical protein
MEEAIQTVSLENGKTLEIYQDEAYDPREDSNLGKMVCFANNYTLGDKHNYDPEDTNSFEELKDAIIEKENPIVILPMYMYNHSGITINTTGFSCKWDSGQIGWIYVTKKQLEVIGVSMNNKETYPEFKKRLLECLVSEVKTYDQYITGDTYRFRIMDKEWNEEDSCGGFYGTDWKTNGLTDYVELTGADLDKL